MGWNPCCCWKLKDAAITIGIWSFVYSIAQLALFGWQWGVLAQCEHVTMAQSNLQCEYWCPCVGASTARTSAIVQVQLAIFGWQMAAIKYERDRAANTLLPNYNTYGRYDIPSYYESYWQSPEERYYTGLFVIQVLCLIASFFLLFASVALIWGVHAWSRFLVWPWIPVMIASILTSVAYCVMWWAGDVRDYWLVLTILEIFGVFVNVYLTLVICVFYSRMNTVLEHYEGERQKRKQYNRFSPNVTSQTDIDVEDAIDQGELGYRNQWDDPDRWYPDPKYPPPPPDPYFDNKPPYPPYGTPVKRPLDEPFEPVSPPTAQLTHAQSVPSLFDDSFRDVPRGHHHHRRSRRHKSCHCNHRRRHSHGHRRSRSRCKHKGCDCSDAGSSEFSINPSESTDSRCHHRHHRHRRDYSDDESDTTCKHRHRSERRGPRQVKRDDREQKELRHSGTQADPDLGEPIIGSPAQGFTIPQHIVIPPVDAGVDADGNTVPRKYQINSEITISYDPRQQQSSASPRPDTRLSGLRSAPRSQAAAPVSITSNV